jgi:DNA repair protein RadC
MLPATSSEPLIATFFPQQSPREKIREHGIESLSTPELIRVILGSGSKNIPASVLAERIAQKLSDQKILTLTDLTSVKGIGLAKAAQILAAIELVERLRPIGFPVIDSVEAVINQVSELKYATREHIVCLYLNTRMQLLLKETLAVGSVNQSILAPRDIFSVIKYHPVSYFILVHNHPSGNPEPSAEDLRFTSIIQTAGRLLGVELLDHVIVGKDTHYSCKAKGQLNLCPELDELMEKLLNLSNR